MAEKHGTRIVLRLLAAAVVGGAGAVAAGLAYEFHPLALVSGGAFGAVVGAAFGVKALEAILHV